MRYREDVQDEERQGNDTAVLARGREKESHPVTETGHRRDAGAASAERMTAEVVGAV